MLTNPSAGRRLAGRLAVLAALAVALPLTATRAIEYVDKVAPAASSAVVAAPAAPAGPAEPQPAVAVEPIRIVQADKGTVTINGKTKRWDELNPEEKAEIRESIAKARRELAEHRFDRGELEREIRAALAEAQLDRQHDLAEARADIARAMSEIDAHRTELRRAGQDPEHLKATIRASLKAVEHIDVEKIKREALASIDPAQIAASVAAAEEAVRDAEVELDRIEALDRED